jgi:hypothetical protein
MGYINPAGFERWKENIQDRLGTDEVKAATEFRASFSFWTLGPHNYEWPFTAISIDALDSATTFRIVR